MNKKKQATLYMGTNISVSKDQLGFSVLSELKERYTHHFMEKVMKWADGRKMFTQKQQRVMTLVEREEDIIFPRGSLQRLEQFLQRRNYEVEVVLELSELHLPFEASFSLELRDYQQEALNEMLVYNDGILQAPCGAGKTVIGIAMVNELHVTSLILVHTSVIFEQWKNHFTDHLGIENVGLLGQGIKDPRPVTVGMIQTLHKFSSQQFEKLRPLYSCIICDECHHVPAYTFLKIITQFCPQYLYGLTATPRRKDQKEFLLFDFIGPIRHVITDNRLVNAKRITDVEVKWIETKSSIFADEWHHMIKALIHLQSRNELIVNEIIEAANDGHFVLMLSERVAHCQLISGMLNDNDVKNMCISGKNKETTEQLLIEAKKDYKIIVASMAIAKEGLDIPELSCIVLATPTNNRYTLKQMIGRGRRYKKRKTLVIDLDDDSFIFVNMANNREGWYEEWNFQQNERPTRVKKKKDRNFRQSVYGSKRR